MDRIPDIPPSFLKSYDFSSYKWIKVTREENDKILILTINRPKKMNALNMETLHELHDFLDKLPTEKNARVVILQGAGKAFCAGLDIGASLMGIDGSKWNIRDYDNHLRISKLVPKIRNAPQIFIAVINGPAAGFGFSLALAADLRIASPNAKFIASFLKIGLSGAEGGTSYFLPRMIGLTKAAEYLLTGRTMKAEEALELGLLNYLVDEEKLLEKAISLSKEMLENSPMGLRFTKEALNLAIESSLEHDLQLTDRQQLLCGYDKGSQKIATKHMLKFLNSKPKSRL